MKFLLLALALLPFTATAETLDQFYTDLKAEMRAKGLSVEVYEAAMAGRDLPQKRVAEKIQTQPESTFSFNDYTARLVSPVRVDNGRKLYKQWQPQLEPIAQKYGLDPATLVALWGIESSYGQFKGDFHIVPALTALAYDSHRRDFFRKELLASVRILQEGHIDQDKFTGSWAGAMGQCQFMPTSFLELAADGNGDGKKDIWNTEPDVFASGANYLSKRGWNTGEAWGQRVYLSKILPKMKISERGLGEQMTVGELAKIGVVPSRGGWRLANNAPARLYIPEGPSGKAWVVYNNFNVILNWNNSSVFAYSVLTLGDEIRAGV